ncbi:polyprenol phosphomannose-dependent alpha 1,6 mannosyltransferase MptB [Gordonia araii]|uniref:polyprenol phosphomannose-dependent alpha 1,6 mannosyltransferase MptB n=1 Tax=Gordonia araii TaxID=263909 RepID=UPI002478C5F4|nr:polyprenol phosphomannose-dependent alpha 1,6 mannosyltransferase MptB [Gordonia araii]
MTVERGEGDLATVGRRERVLSWWRRWEFPVGMLGSVLVALGAFGVADIPRVNTAAQDAGWAWITYGHGKTLAAVLFWTGVALLVFCWVRIGRIVAAGDGIGVRQMRAAVLAWAAPLTMTVPVYSRDVYAYLAQAEVFRAGFNPYSDGPVHQPGPMLDSMAQVWAATTAPYGPTFMWLGRGVVALADGNVILGVQLMRAVLIPGLLLSLWAIPRLARHFGASPQQGLWLAVLNPMILIHLVAGAHVELLMMGVLVAGVALAVTGRAKRGGCSWWHVTGLAVLGLAATIKITAAIAIPFVFWIWLAHLRDRADETDPGQPLTRGRVAAVFAATATIPLAVFALISACSGLGIGWLTGLTWAGRIINWLSIPTLVGHLVTWIAAPWQAWNLQAVLVYTRAVGAVVLAVLLVAMWIRFRQSERSAMAGMVLAMLAVLLLEPSTLPWYYTWVLCLAVAFTLPGWVRAVVVFASTVQLIVFQPDDSILLYKPLELLLAFALGALAAIALLRPDPLRLRRLAGIPDPPVR